MLGTQGTTTSHEPITGPQNLAVSYDAILLRRPENFHPKVRTLQYIQDRTGLLIAAVPGNVSLRAKLHPVPRASPKYKQPQQGPKARSERCPGKMLSTWPSMIKLARAACCKLSQDLDGKRCYKRHVANVDVTLADKIRTIWCQTRQYNIRSGFGMRNKQARRTRKNIRAASKATLPFKATRPLPLGLRLKPASSSETKCEVCHTHLLTHCKLVNRLIVSKTHAPLILMKTWHGFGWVAMLTKLVTHVQGVLRP